LMRLCVAYFAIHSYGKRFLGVAQPGMFLASDLSNRN
jgi:hypothetical protein